MNLICKKLNRNQIINIFKYFTGDSFVVNENKIPMHKENYFRLYLDGNENEYIELFFGQLGELISFGYSSKMIDSSRNAEISECGNYRVLTRIAPAVKNFMKFAVEALEHESSLHDNAKRLYNFLNKNV
ncbi:MAG: hypothetical protein J6R59_01910 [Paludibacteraceae bacterium]|nr:hypothetical protein [Paludibacteraceae bacterium]